MTSFVHGFLVRLIVQRRIRHTPALDFAERINLVLKPGFVQFGYLAFGQRSIVL